MSILSRQPGIDDALEALGVPAELHHELISHPNVRQAVQAVDHIYGRVRADHSRLGWVPHEHHAVNRQMLDDARKIEAIHTAAARVISHLIGQAESILSPLGAYHPLPSPEPEPAPEGDTPPPDPTAILTQPFAPPEGDASPVEPEPEAPPESPLAPEGDASPKRRKGS